MRKPEQRLWDALRPALRQAGFVTTRVENSVDDGFPDVIAQHRACGFVPIELKAREQPPERITSKALADRYGLRKSQLNWWLAFGDAGGVGWIVTRLGRINYLHSGAHAQRINAMSFEEFCDCAAAVGSVHDVVAGVLSK